MTVAFDRPVALDNSVAVRRARAREHFPGVPDIPVPRSSLAASQAARLHQVVVAAPPFHSKGR
ncbi:Uncharacterised protein [Mycobacteroides abscessus subsp. abscessus]|nr:Uncharacterised protein [Mycobacteroides abscessus subsp. abscessus]SKG41907.1 Uncharacterised protein [Mycobacteroides abscessus subsp. massiliense]SHS48267.1 Uncharacterised protein [Mycobacteroides abscessus subsp. abscessus]SHS90281.1 Uncharacterised protein [Mycobacteroides abscessus subsp. abscessus]SHT36546.1 Uncharacterised protein [Mycobacteroides abscessus subsp. abscessus]